MYYPYYKNKYIKHYENCDGIYIYVIKCQEDKYYVGKTNNIRERLKEHKYNQGSEWTKKYRPINIEEIYYTQNGYAEDDLTITVMKKYGIKNVRGGCFCKLILSQEEIFSIKLLLNRKERELTECIMKRLDWSACDLCLRCGRNSHMINECYASYDVCGDKL